MVGDKPSVSKFNNKTNLQLNALLKDMKKERPTKFFMKLNNNLKKREAKILDKYWQNENLRRDTQITEILNKY